MAIDWNQLEAETSKPKSTFGDLTAGNYKLQVSMQYTTAGTSKSDGEPMLTLNTKTVSGDSGMGTYVKIYIKLAEDNESNAKNMLRLGEVLGVTAVDFIGKSNPEIVEFMYSKLSDEVTFYADVQDPQEYNGKKQFGAWANTISKFPKQKQSGSAEPVAANNKWEIAVDTAGTATDPEAVKSDFGF